MQNSVTIGEKVKARLRNAAPGAFDALVKLRHGPAMRNFEGARSRMRVRKILRSGQPFRMDIYGKMGFGAVLMNLVLLHHRFDKEAGFKGIVSSNPLYAQENLGQAGTLDVIDLFFDRLDPAWDQESTLIPYGHERDVTTGVLSAGLTISSAHQIFNEHYAVKPRFMDEATSLLGAREGEPIGVHFRGSDKRTEAARIPWETYAAAVEESLGRSESKSIFVATDEAGFFEFMKQRFGSENVWALECQYMADGLIPAHFLEGNGFEKGREALVTMLILSMCSVCVRGPSNLSAFAKILNPALPIVMLGEPFPPIPFPENELLGHKA